jgi:histidyl-tRNA synthetase
MESRKDKLDEDSLRRLDRNPLRILDSKNPDVQSALDGAPALPDFLGTESRTHFTGLQALLNGLGVEFQVNPRLVRGLDYYSHSVFEWISDDLGAQGTICAGGRYDGLVELQGGKPWPAVGFAMGLERIIELLRENGEREPSAAHAYLVLAGEGVQGVGLQLARRLREALPGLRLISNIGGGSFKAQFKRADKSGAQLALVIGEDEAARKQVTVKPLRDERDQFTVSHTELTEHLRNLIDR